MPCNIIEHRFRAGSSLLGILVVFALLPGCRQDGQDASSTLPPDDRGVAPGLSKSPERLVILSPSITEMAFALGAGEMVVGVSRYCRWPEETKYIPKVGGGLDPNPESILKLNPDIILSSGSRVSPPLRRLEESGLPVAYLNHESLEDVFSDIKTLSIWLKREREGKALLEKLHKERDFIADRVAGQDAPKPSVVVLFGFQDLLSAGRGSFPSDIIKLAGGENLADTIDTPWPVLSPEKLLKWNPEIILFALTGEESEEEIKEGILQFSKDPRWRALRAVRDNKLYPVENSLLSIPGPRSIRAAKILAGYFYPEQNFSL